MSWMQKVHRSLPVTASFPDQPGPPVLVQMMPQEPVPPQALPVPR
jgi:hypothetical protein